MWETDSGERQPVPLPELQEQDQPGSQTGHGGQKSEPVVQTLQGNASREYRPWPVLYDLPVLKLPSEKWVTSAPDFFAPAGGSAEGKPEAGISPIRLKQLLVLLQSGEEFKFYSWPEWRALRAEVLKLDKHECQRCKALRHRYRPAKIVHHVKHLKDRPDLALSVWDGGRRQLVSVCKDCHEELHPESQRQFRRLAAPLTEERWD